MRKNLQKNPNLEFTNSVKNFEKEMKNLFSSQTHVFQSKKDAIKFFDSIINIIKNEGIGYLYEVLRISDLIEDIKKLMIKINSSSNNKTGDMQIIISFKYYENNKEIETFIKYDTSNRINNNLYRKNNNYSRKYADGYYSKIIPISTFKDTIIFDDELLILIELIGYSKDKISLD